MVYVLGKVQQNSSFQLKVFMEKYHHDLSEVGYKCPVNGFGIVVHSMPHSWERMRDQMHDRDT